MFELDYCNFDYDYNIADSSHVRFVVTSSTNYDNYVYDVM